MFGVRQQKRCDKIWWFSVHYLQNYWRSHGRTDGHGQINSTRHADHFHIYTVRSAMPRLPFFRIKSIYFLTSQQILCMWAWNLVFKLSWAYLKNMSLAFRDQHPLPPLSKFVYNSHWLKKSIMKFRWWNYFLIIYLSKKFHSNDTIKTKVKTNLFTLYFPLFIIVLILSIYFICRFAFFCCCRSVPWIKPCVCLV